MESAGTLRQAKPLATYAQLGINAKTECSLSALAQEMNSSHTLDRLVARHALPDMNVQANMWHQSFVKKVTTLFWEVQSVPCVQQAPLAALQFSLLSPVHPVSIQGLAQPIAASAP